MSGFTVISLCVIIICVWALGVHRKLSSLLRKADDARMELAPLLRRWLDALYDTAEVIDGAARLRELCAEYRDAEQDRLIHSYPIVKRALGAVQAAGETVNAPLVKLTALAESAGEKYNNAAASYNEALASFWGRAAAFIYSLEPVELLKM